MKRKSEYTYTHAHISVCSYLLCLNEKVHMIHIIMSWSKAIRENISIVFSITEEVCYVTINATP